jgi:hypothetical protein
VFEDGHKVPVVFYDVHGRAVLLGEDEHRGLYLAEDDNDAVRIRMVGGEALGVLRDIERAAGQYFRDVGMSEIADDEPLPVEALAGYQCAASGVGCG